MPYFRAVAICDDAVLSTSRTHKSRPSSPPCCIPHVSSCALCCGAALCMPPHGDRNPSRSLEHNISSHTSYFVYSIGNSKGYARWMCNIQYLVSRDAQWTTAISVRHSNQLTPTVRVMTVTIAGVGYRNDNCIWFDTCKQKVNSIPFRYSNNRTCRSISVWKTLRGCQGVGGKNTNHVWYEISISKVRYFDFRKFDIDHL